jgi:hypothetical protein
MRYASDISLFFAIPWLVACVILSWWFYRKVSWLKELQIKWQWLLTSLRTVVLFVLGLLLFGLIFESVEYRVEKPIIITLVDRSASMLNYKDSTNVGKQIESFRKALNASLGEEYEMVEMYVGADAANGDLRDFKEPLSNHQAGFEKIRSEYYNRNVGGIVFISDGNFNKGSHPVYTAEKINLTPVFTLGTGDTTQKRDQFIKNVASNDIAFLKNKFPVEVDVEAIKMGREGATVSISQNGNVLATKKIQYKDGKRDFEHVSFELEAKGLGFQTYTVSVSKAGNEYNYKNNSRVFYIEVVDSRNKVLLIAGAPHPDVAAIKEVLEQDENLEVTSVLLKDWKKDVQNVDLVIWHEPGIMFDAGLQNQLVNQNVAVMYVIGPNTSAATISKLSAGLQVSGGSQTEELQGTLNKDFNQFDLSEEVKKAIPYFPPLLSKFGDIRLSTGIETLLYQRIGSIQKKEPLIFFGKRGNTKFGVIYGEGLWQWKINDFVRNKSFNAFSELIQKSMQYLVVKQNNSPLRVTFPKRFTKNEEVIVNAGFYNESMEPITTSTIVLEVKDEDGKRNKLDFAVAGNGYYANLGQLKPGKYEWKAYTKYKGKTYQKNGVFVVEDIELESLDNYANHGTLKQLASQTNGAFTELKNYQSIIDKIKKRDDITSMSYKESAFNGLIDYKWLFFLLLLLLAIEWFLRRWLGAY